MSSDLKERILAVDGWEIHGDIYMGYDAYLDTQNFTKAEFNNIDKRLAPLLEHLIKNTQYPSGPHPIGMEFRLTLEYWSNQEAYLNLPDSNYVKHLVASIQEIDFLPGEDSVIFDVKEVYPLQFKAHNGKTITYIEDCGRDNVAVPKVWMDNNYPDWYTRLQASRALGYPLNEQALHVMMKSPNAVKVAIDDISFE